MILVVLSFRRFVWNFFRLENEHLNNCGQFRAVRDISIAPMNCNDQSLLEQMMDDDDGVTNRRTAIDRKYRHAASWTRLPSTLRCSYFILTLSLCQTYLTSDIQCKSGIPFLFALAAHLMNLTFYLRVSAFTDVLPGVVLIAQTIFLFRVWTHRHTHKVTMPLIILTMAWLLPVWKMKSSG